MKTSVFGGTGYIGKRFCELNHDNVNVVNRNERASNSDNIVYFISTTDNYNVFSDVHVDIDTNLSILVDVLEAARKKHEKFTFNYISTWFVYGDVKLPALETSECKPKGFYSITKKCAEDLIESYCKTYGANYRIIRLANVYGLSDNRASKKKNALHFLIDKIVNDAESIDLYHGGEFFRDYIHIDDACRAIKLIIGHGEMNTIYNVGNGISLKFIDLMNKAKDFSCSNTQFNNIEPTKFHSIVQVKDMYLETTKLKSLGFMSEKSIDEGIVELCKLMKK